jgi:hypothetical protein
MTSSLSTNEYTLLNENEFIHKLVYYGANVIQQVFKHQPELITPKVLDQFSRIISSETPTEAPYRINNVIWNLAKIWNQINYRCFLWALYANYGETIRTLHAESTVITENSLFYKSEFSHVLSIEDYDHQVAEEDVIDFPILPQKPTDKEYNFLYQLYISNNYPLELYKYVRSQLTPEQIIDWRSLCQEKIIIAKVISKSFWLLNSKKLLALQSEFINALCQRYLNLSDNPEYELQSSYDFSLKEHHALNKHFDKSFKEIPQDKSIAPFHHLNISEKRDALRESCIAHLNGSKNISLEFKKYLAIYNIKTSFEDNEGRTIAIFRLIPWVFDDISDFNILFRNEVEQYLFKLYMINRYPSFFKILANTPYFNLVWFLNLELEHQICIAKYYKDLVFSNLNNVYRQSPEIVSHMLNNMSMDEREQLARNNISNALNYRWDLSNEFLLENAKKQPLTYFIWHDSVSLEILWEAALASPQNAFQYVAHKFSDEQKAELKRLIAETNLNTETV